MGVRAGWLILFTILERELEMANTLTSLIPDVYEALRVVNSERTGMLRSVNMDSSANRVALGQSVLSPVAPPATLVDITPGVTAPNTGDQVIDNTSVTIEFSKAAPFRINGEETLGLNNNGPGVLTIQQQQIAQAFRAIRNAQELGLCQKAAVNASRAFGTPATTPFASDLSDSANVGKILIDNGAPSDDMSLVFDTTAGVNVRSKTGLAKVNESGDQTLLRRGELADVFGMMFRESAGIQSVTAGTGSSATTDDSGYAVGDTVITLAAAGTGTIIAGDIITFAGDTNKYVVASGDADVSDGGTITLQAPGLRVAIAGSTTAITVVAGGPRNVALTRDAIVLAHRLPAMPEGGDMADDREIIIDPQSGVAYELAVYRQYRQVHYEIGCAWGFGAPNPQNIALLLG